MAECTLLPLECLGEARTVPQGLQHSIAIARVSKITKSTARLCLRRSKRSFFIRAAAFPALRIHGNSFRTRLTRLQSQRKSTFIISRQHTVHYYIYCTHVHVDCHVRSLAVIKNARKYVKSFSAEDGDCYTVV